MINVRTGKGVRLVAEWLGSTSIHVYRGHNKAPHFVIVGAEIQALAIDKVAEYMYGCDWTDKGSPGWITPQLRCDEFMLNNKQEIKW